MAKHKNLHEAKINKYDEFYTQLSDIENELRHYKQHFKDKVVFCNCDDPYESNFFKYFAMNFNSLGLKKLIATGYSTSPILGTELNVWTGEETEVKERVPYVAYINEVKDMNGDGRIDLEDVKILLKEKRNCRRKLHGNGKYPAGDFRSEESISLLKQADVVVTNPPFSLFREYVQQLIEYDKKFLIIGNKNSLTFKEIFPLIKNNQLWVGCKSMSADMLFDVSDEYKQELLKGKVGGKYRIVDGVVKGRAAAIWYTNLDIKKRHEDLILYKNYNPNDYLKFDNFDAINIDKTKDIPCDYDGVMGVPITFLDKYNPDQFEIVGFGQGDIMYEHGVSQEFVDAYRKSGQKGTVHKGHPFLVYYRQDGYPVIPYFRILIKRR